MICNAKLTKDKNLKSILYIYRCFKLDDRIYFIVPLDNVTDGQSNSVKSVRSSLINKAHIIMFMHYYHDAQLR